MTDRYVPVKGFSGLVRDKETNAIHNVDVDSIEQARESKRLRRLKRQEEKELVDRVTSLENELAAIKEHLKNL
jgi:hypothetical protein